MTNMTAIETYYDGHRFRSRLEARWATFFNSGVIKYEYEPEGYKLSDGTLYLPDFYLPEYDMYVEVKRDTLDGIKEVEEKCVKAITWGGPIKKILVLSNVPEGKSPDGGIWHFPIVYWHDDDPVWGWAFFYDTPESTVTVGVPRDLNSDWYLWRRHRDESQKTLGPVTDWEFRHSKPKDSNLTLQNYIKMQEEFNKLTFRSFNYARYARFEYGETPPTASEFKAMRKAEAEQERKIETELKATLGEF